MIENSKVIRTNNFKGKLEPEISDQILRLIRPKQLIVLRTSFHYTDCGNSSMFRNIIATSNL